MLYQGDRLSLAHFYRMLCLMISCLVIFIILAIFDAVLPKSWQLWKIVHLLLILSRGTLSNSDQSFRFFAWGQLCILFHVWLVQYWVPFLLFGLWPFGTQRMLFTKSIVCILQETPHIYLGHSVPNHRNPVEVIHLSDCKPHFVSKVPTG